METGPLANVLMCEGKPGKVLFLLTSSHHFSPLQLALQVFEIRAKCRQGEENFVLCMRKALIAKYKDKSVSLGGVFNIVKGAAHLHVMVCASKLVSNECSIFWW